MLINFTLITISLLISFFIFNFFKVISSIRKLVESYKNYFKELKKFGLNQISIKEFLSSLKELFYLTLILLIKLILVVLPFLMVFLL